jgi:hypothetical protein
VTVRRSAVIALTLAICATCTACSSGDDDDTLLPLPIEGGTAAPGPSAVVTAVPTAAATSTTAAAGTTTTAATSTTTTVVDTDGDWDGARFDVGMVSGLTKVGVLDAVSFDRWTYDAPDGRRLDATTLDAEPLVAWWRVSPFLNVQVRNRTFALAPGVEVLVLDPAGRAAACADPPPAAPPAPTWTAATTAALTDAANVGAMAMLTYSGAGQVTRIRLTRGC